MHKVDCILSQGEKRSTKADNLPYRLQVVVEVLKLLDERN
jgi:hypothetical protein